MSDRKTETTLEVPTDDALRVGVYAFQHSYSEADTLNDWRAFYMATTKAMKDGTGLKHIAQMAALAGERR